MSYVFQLLGLFGVIASLVISVLVGTQAGAVAAITMGVPMIFGALVVLGLGADRKAGSSGHECLAIPPHQFIEFGLTGRLNWPLRPIGFATALDGVDELGERGTPKHFRRPV